MLWGLGVDVVGSGEGGGAEDDGREAGFGRDLTCTCAGICLSAFRARASCRGGHLGWPVTTGSVALCYAEAVVFAFEGGDADESVAVTLLPGDRLHGGVGTELEARQTNSARIVCHWRFPLARPQDDARSCLAWSGMTSAIKSRVSGPYLKLVPTNESVARHRPLWIE